MSLNLKINLPALGVTKIMRFSEQMSVNEVCKQVLEKTNVGGKDHCLFQPSPPSDTTSVGRWLKPERTLEYYDLKTNDTVEYRKKHDVIKVGLIDGTLKSMLVDLSAPVSEVIDLVGEKLSLRNPEEFSFQVESKPGVWLKSQLPITEQVGSLDQTFLLKKKFFIHDVNVDTDDPVSLHLIYCQSRDDINNGKHAVTRDEAINFAALQCQVQMGDLKPDLHKPGYLEPKDILPPAHAKRDNEKLVLQEWKKIVGMNDMHARLRYVQLCRSLKTYGMTTFKVKERVPGKKKLMDAILAFTRDSIIRMEYDTKRVIKEYPFKYLLRWTASPETFTMDFGAHEEDYIVVVTNEGEAISNLIAGYIDLLLKKQRVVPTSLEDDDGEMASVTSVARIGGVAMTALTNAGRIHGDSVAYTSGVNDCSSAARAIDKMISDLFGEVAKMSDGSMTPAQRRQAVEAQARALHQLGETLSNFALSGDRASIAASALKIASGVEQLIGAARQAAASGADAGGVLMDATKGVSDALKALLMAADACAQRPGDQDAKDALMRAQLAAAAALQKLAALSKGINNDDGYQQLFKELARAVGAESQIMIREAQAAAGRVQDPTKRNQLNSATKALTSADDQFAHITDSLAPVASEAACKSTIQKAGNGVENTANYLVQLSKTIGLDPRVTAALADSEGRLRDALRNLMGASDLPNMQGAQEAEDFTEAAHQLLMGTAAIMAAEGNPALIKQQAGEIKNAATKLGQAGKAIVGAQTDPAQRERLANYLKNVVEATKHVLTAAPACIQNPDDHAGNKKLIHAAQELAEATQQLLGDTGRQVAVAALYNAAKIAAGSTTKLCTSSRMVTGEMNDPNASDQLSEAARAAAEAVQKLIDALKGVNSAAPPSMQRRSTFVRKPSSAMNELLKDDLMTAAEKFAPVAYKLVSVSKNISGKVPDGETKQELIYSSSNAAKAIHKMLANRKAMKAVKGQLETAEAIEEFKASQADIESALIAADTGILQPTKNKDDALIELASAIQEVGQTAKDVGTTAKTAPEDLGQSMKTAAAANSKCVNAGIALAASVNDRNVQKGILNALKSMNADVKNLMQIAKAVSAAPDDPNLNKLLLGAGKSVAEALMRLTEASKGVVPKKVEEFQNKAASDLEDLAEKELKGAADVIDKCAAKLQQALEAARRRAAEKQIDVDEQNITEAILEASQAIAKATGVLINAATQVQQEFQSLLKEPKTAPMYKRDPQWAQGLISAARTVAGAVQHLVKEANNAAQGNASEEALIVAAHAVSAATTQLVTASTVKADPNSSAQRRLREASARVTASTGQLVNAAKEAAKWEQEKKQEEDDEKYNLTENKIKEMEKMMQILRLEKELESARNQLGGMRKAEYADATGPASPSSPSAKATASPKSSGAPPAKAAGRGVQQAPRGRGGPPPQGQGRGIAWKTSSMGGPPQ
eukprot:TRINITY_DN1675_c0_g1_i1.p1 TRINITY_DN1675_c0_g1~~TRINITY_DN1675_c0_g1_i1.p1  ORF type:complete len:1447 (-),score=577.25 TRINITY_DN1675_c0_g1_i1:61-4401(-)